MPLPELPALSVSGLAAWDAEAAHVMLLCGAYNRLVKCFHSLLRSLKQLSHLQPGDVTTLAISPRSFGAHLVLVDDFMVLIWVLSAHPRAPLWALGAWSALHLVHSSGEHRCAEPRKDGAIAPAPLLIAAGLSLPYQSFLFSLLLLSLKWIRFWTTF